MYNQGWSDQQRGVNVKALTPKASDITVFYTGLLSEPPPLIEDGGFKEQNLTNFERVSH